MPLTYGGGLSTHYPGIYFCWRSIKNLEVHIIVTFLTVPMLQQYIPCTTTTNTRINCLGNDNMKVSCGRDRRNGHTFRDSRSGPVRIDRTLNM